MSAASRKWYTLPLSLLSHTLVLAAMVSLSRLAATAMPAVLSAGPEWIPIADPPVPPPV